MLDRIREWLVPTDALERHVLTARLLGRPSSVIDVGGIGGQLGKVLPGARVTTVNVDPGADIVIDPGPHPLPLPDRAAEAAASLDTLEHIPRSDRELFVAETLRVAASRVVLCCPLGGSERTRIEQADNDWYLALTGNAHPWISEHLEHGAPTQSDLEHLFARDDYVVTYRYSGDLRATSRQFRMAETSNVRRRPVDITRWVAFRCLHRPDLGLQPAPSPHTNRVFVIADRRG